VVQECDDSALLAAQLELYMKIVTVEHLLGGERVIYYFMADGRVDFRGLVRELADRHQTRIEMRQVGPRDEARLVADYEICGRECCCKNFLKTLRPVTMKMAKIQKATLDLSKVSGRCGRLRCCLRYEHEGYESLAKKLPRKGLRVRSEFGVGAVVDRQILTQLVMIQNEDGKVITVPLEEITEFDVPKTAEAPPPIPKPERRSPPAIEASPDSAPAAKRTRRRRRRSPKPDGKPGVAERTDRPEPAAADPPATDDATGKASTPPSDAKGKGTPEAGKREPRADGPKRRRRRRRRRGPRKTGGDSPPAKSDD
jgi:hypothetical protein